MGTHDYGVCHANLRWRKWHSQQAGMIDSWKASSSPLGKCWAFRFLELEGPILARITADKNLGRVEGCQNIYLSLFRLVHQEILIPSVFWWQIWGVERWSLRTMILPYKTRKSWLHRQKGRFNNRIRRAEVHCVVLLVKTCALLVPLMAVCDQIKVWLIMILFKL